jgi:hypothetical protein
MTNEEGLAKGGPIATAHHQGGKKLKSSDDECRLWHYTTGRWLDQILKDGFIKPATEGVPQGERPIVWFSKNQHWEQTVSKLGTNPDGTLIQLDMAQTGERGGGLVRIEVESMTAPHDWNDLKERSGMRAKMATSLYSSGIAQRARPREWRGMFEAVPRSKWIAIERYEDGRWTAYDPIVQYPIVQDPIVDEPMVDEPIVMGRPERLAELCSLEFRESLRSAAVVLGKDENTDNQFVVFGLDMLQVIASGKTRSDRAMLVVPILQHTDELEALITAVSIVKGRHDYKALEQAAEVGSKVRK